MDVSTGADLSISTEPSAAWKAAREPGVHNADAWIEYRAAMGNAPRYLMADGTAGVMYEKRPRFRPWKKSLVFLDRAPTSIATALLPVARDRGWLELRVHSFDGPFGTSPLEGYESTQRYEFLLDLTVDRFAACKGSHRRKIRKAEKAGVTVTEETGDDGVAILHALQGHTQARRQDRGEEMSLPDASQYRTLARTLVARGGGRLVVGRKDGEPVSCILIGVGGARAYYLMGGTSPAGFSLNSASLVMWRAIELLTADGFEVLNLGGVGVPALDPEHAGHGLYRFKDGWGGDRAACHNGVWRP